MSDEKAKDKGEGSEKQPEIKPLVSSDAQVVRLSGQAEIKEVERDRTNQSDGSLRKYLPGGRALPADWEQQNESIEISDGDKKISRTSPLREADLAKPENKNESGKQYVVYTAEAAQAVQKPGPIDKALTEGSYQSPVKLNVQITNVPEVSAPLNHEEAIKYTSKVMEAGAAAVRQTEQHFTVPNAINADVISTAMHFGQSPHQFNHDVLDVVSNTAQALDKPMTAEQRAGMAGALVPMFFFEGGQAPIEGKAAQQMKLDQMTGEQLKALGIERVEMNMPEVPPELRHMELTKAEPELFDAMRQKGRELEFAEPGSPARNRLDESGKEASVLICDGQADLITLKVGAPKIAALEEFLHGSQMRNPALSDLPTAIKEIHVKDFMIRHPRLLGLSQNDLAVLRVLMDNEIETAYRQGWMWKK